MLWGGQSSADTAAAPDASLGSGPPGLGDWVLTFLGYGWKTLWEQLNGAGRSLLEHVPRGGAEPGGRPFIP